MRNRRTDALLMVVLSTGCVSRIKDVDCAREPLLCPERLEKAPRLQVEPAFGLSFDCVALGCEQTRELVVTNRGGGVIQLTMVRLTLDTSADFSVQLVEQDPGGTEQDLPPPRREESMTAAGVGPLALTTERSIIARVRYVPSDAEADQGGVLIEYDDGRWDDVEERYQRVEMPLYARVLGVARAAVRSSVVNFGHVAVGEQKSALIMLENVSPGTSILEVSEAHVTGATDADADDSPSVFALGIGWSPLANPGELIEVPVSFAPEHEGAFWGTVVLHTNDPAQAEIRAELRGLSAGTAQLALVEPLGGQLDFGIVRLGQIRRLALTLRNHGTLAVDIAAEVNAGPDASFAMVGPATASPQVGPFEEVRFLVEYAPANAGPASAALRVLASEPTYAPVEIPLTGFCSAPEPALSATRMELGSLVRGWTGAPKTLSVYNRGTGELTVTRVELEIGSSNQVRLPSLPPLPVMLSPDDPPLDVTIYLQANALGPVTAALLIHTDGIVEPVRRVLLGGEVVSCEQGCPVANGVPDCSAGFCGLQACEDGWHDTDLDLGNGCECREERLGNDIGGTCATGLDLGTVGDKCSGAPGTIERTGNLHDGQDVDLYFVRSDDATALGCDVFGDSSGTGVTLSEAPAGLALCARISDKGAGCGGYSAVLDPSYCGATEYRHGGSYGADDDREMTAWVVWHPDASPVCGAYKLRFSGRK